eukprot:7371558-Prorocentrum_lima.AAC.1
MSSGLAWTRLRSGWAEAGAPRGPWTACRQAGTRSWVSSSVSPMWRQTLALRRQTLVRKAK